MGERGAVEEGWVRHPQNPSLLYEQNGPPPCIEPDAEKVCACTQNRGMDQAKRSLPSPQKHLYSCWTVSTCARVLVQCVVTICSAFLFRRISYNLLFVPSIAAHQMILLGEQGNGEGVTLGPPAAVPDLVAFASWHPATPPAYNTCQHEYG